MKITSITNFSKVTILIFFFMAAFIACKKSNSGIPIIPIEAGLKANFGYKTGSYWIYKDSVSGATDSAYVYNYYLDSFYKGCVLMAGEPKFQGMNIIIGVSNGNPSDTEQWYLFLEDSTFSINMKNNRDSTESQLGFTLFKYPFRIGANGSSLGCEPSPDSSLTDIIPEVSLNNQSFTNAAKSDHSLSAWPHSRFPYNDCFYVNETAGMVKIVFNHPKDFVHRVLELQRYKIVR